MSDNNQESPPKYGFDETEWHNALDHASLAHCDDYNRDDDAHETAQTAFQTGAKWAWAKVRAELSKPQSASNLRSESPHTALDVDEYKKISTIIGETIGEAAMCWDPVPSGIFDSSLAHKLWGKTMIRLRDVRSDSSLRTESETTKPQELDLRSCMCPKYLEQIQALTQANECLKEYIRGFEAASDIVCQERDGYRISLAQLEQQIKEFAGVKDD